MQRRISMWADDGGQTLIYVAISMIVLLGFVALAVDVGYLYAERRHMQNAADAGALEAARALCFGVNVTASDAAAMGQAFMLANNSRPDALSRTYTVVPNALNLWEFDATAEEVSPLFFAGAIGVAPPTVRATARAACGSTQKTCGLFPLAFDQSIWKNLPCNSTVFVWTSDLDKDTGNDADNAPSCTTCDCDRVYIHNQLQPGAVVMANVGRAWLDFTSAIPDELRPDSCAGGNGCGANELKCWVDNDSKALFSLPKCVSGDSGVKLGVRSNVNGRVGDYVKLPLFEGRCTPGEGLRGACKEGFWVTQFGCMQVQEWRNSPIELEWKITPTPPPQGNPNPGRCWKGQLMPVKVACNQCETECGSTTGGGDPGSGIKAVSLIK